MTNTFKLKRAENGWILGGGVEGAYVFADMVQLSLWLGKNVDNDVPDRSVELMRNQMNTAQSQSEEFAKQRDQLLSAQAESYRHGVEAKAASDDLVLSIKTLAAKYDEQTAQLNSVQECLDEEEKKTAKLTAKLNFFVPKKKVAKKKAKKKAARKR